MKNLLLPVLFTLLLFTTACSKKLDDVPLPFNDNPYDNDYKGAKVVRIDSIVNDTTSGNRNEIYYTKLYDKNDGVRLYKNGTLVNTHYNSVSHTVFIADNSAVSGLSYTYTLKIFLGSGESPSDPIIYTTP